MKGLSSFNRFAHEPFFADKSCMFVKAETLSDFNSGEVLGSKVTLQIMRDDTKYPKADTTNIGEQFKVKVLGVSPDHFAKCIPFETRMKLDKVQKVSVYGDFNHLLSITASLVEVK